MKSAKKEKTKTEEQHQNLVPIKAETESEDAFEVCVGEDGFNIQIKEEPYSQEIGEDPSRDTSDWKCGTVTSESDIHQLEEYIKDEHNSIHVKEEEELWLKEERDSEDEEADEREEESTGRQCENNATYATFASFFHFRSVKHFFINNIFEPR